MSGYKTKKNSLYIERPDAYKFMDKDCKFDDDAFHKWFSENITPLNDLIENAVEVHGHIEDDNEWYMFTHKYGELKEQLRCGHSHHGLLLDVSPIPTEKASSLIFDIVVNDISEKEIRARAKLIQNGEENV